MLKRLTMIGAVALVSGCGQEGASMVGQVQAMPQAVAARAVDFSQVARGGRLYQQNCAECHGLNAEGAPNWRQRDPDGMFPPPPLNGTGHAWHHPGLMLHYVIANGSPGGQGKMPAWKDKLSSGQINDIMAWFMAKWPDEVYQAWYERNGQVPQGG